LLQIWYYLESAALNCFNNNFFFCENSCKNISVTSSIRQCTDRFITLVIQDDISTYHLNIN
jgi:hypothetical protein